MNHGVLELEHQEPGSPAQRRSPAQLRIGAFVTVIVQPGTMLPV